jgi:hypothetical protein
MQTQTPMQRAQREYSYSGMIDGIPDNRIWDPIRIRCAIAFPRTLTSRFWLTPFLFALAAAAAFPFEAAGADFLGAAAALGAAFLAGAAGLAAGLAAALGAV